MNESGAAASSVMRSSAFVRLWIATTASGLATWALPFVLGLAIVHGEISASSVGLLLAGRTAGFIAAVPVGGLYADRFSTVHVVRVAALLAAAASPVLAFTAGGHNVVAVVASIVMGVGQGACRPAFQAHVPRVVDAARRQQANAAITLAVRVATLLGPATAALLARFVPARSLVLVIGVLWLVAALAPARGPRDDDMRVPVGGRAHPVRDVADGFLEASRHRWFVAGLLALAPIIAFGYSATSIVLPQVSQELGGGDAVFAAATMAYTIGALLGAVVMSRWRPRNEGWVAFFGIGLYALAPLTLLTRPPAVWIVAAYVIVGVGMEVFNVPWFTATQREVDPDKLARVSSIDFLVSYGLAPIGLAVYPWAIQSYGREKVLSATLVLCILMPLLAAMAPGARWLRSPNAPTEGA